MKTNFLPLLLTLILFSLTSCTSQLIGKPTENQTSDNEQTFINSGSQPLESPTEEQLALESVPEEFKDLTIPYLRNRSYPGSQISINSTVNNNASYTSYLSSYESDGLTINALLTKPKTEMPVEGYPGVVFIHGYIPPLQYRTTEKYVAYVDYLARNGLVVLKIDLRGHGSSEGEPSGAYFSASYIIDALNAYESLKTLDYVNPAKIGLWGHSMAGNVVFRSMVVQPEIPGIVIWSGAVYTYADMQEFGIQDSSYAPNQNPNRNRRQRLRDVLGDVNSGHPFWNIFIPTNYAQDIQGKIQIHHPVNDPVVSVEYSRNLKTILDTQAIMNEVYEYPSGGHNLDGATFGQAMERTVTFFKEM